MAAAIRDSSKGNLKLVYSVAPFIALQQLVVRVFSVLMLTLSVSLFTAEVVSFAWGVLFVVVSFMVFHKLGSAGSQITMLQMLASSIDMANSMDDTPVMDEGGTDITPVHTGIVFRDVGFAYTTRKILGSVLLGQIH